MPEIKLCKDCKWCHMTLMTWYDDNTIVKIHKCTNEKCGAHVDPVDGSSVQADCHEARAKNMSHDPVKGSCGVDGKYWEMHDGKERA